MSVWHKLGPPGKGTSLEELSLALIDAERPTPYVGSTSW